MHDTPPASGIRRPIRHAGIASELDELGAVAHPHAGRNTRDDAEAERLRSELNILLGDPQYHDPAARAKAERRFDPRVVDIFFDKMAPEETDFPALRDAVIPLPEAEPDGYRRMLFLGTTGAGKTTLVRQLIGTDPMKERFPSTSTAKTTTHDTEIVLADGDWRAVVTFASRDEVREYLNECISAAVLSAASGATDAEVLRRLLNHVNQRFRFSYVLGNGSPAAVLESDFEDDEEEPEGEPAILSAEERDAIDLGDTERLLSHTTKMLRELARRLGNDLRAQLDVESEEDERVAKELFEEELDNLLRDEEDFHQVGDALIEEIEKRFDLLPPGRAQKDETGLAPRVGRSVACRETRRVSPGDLTLLQQLRSLLRSPSDTPRERCARGRPLLARVERW